MTQSRESLRPDTFTKTGPGTPTNFETMRQENNVTEVPHSAVNEPQSNVTAVRENIMKSVRSSKKILYSKSSRKSLLDKSVESLPKQSEPGSSSLSKVDTPVKPSTTKSRPADEEIPQESKQSTAQAKSVKSKAKSKTKERAEVPS